MDSRGLQLTLDGVCWDSMESTGIPYIPVDSMKVLAWNSVEFHGFHRDSTHIPIDSMTVLHGIPWIPPGFHCYL
jgi:hypothetical protein